MGDGAAAAAIRAILHPRSVAVVGATERMQYGGRFFANLLESDLPDGVFPINPRRAEVLGVRCYPSVRDLPRPVDLAAIIVPAERVIPALEDCAARGVPAAIVISAGYAERADDAGEKMQAELGAAVRRTGVRVVGPNCFGVANLAANLHANSHFGRLDLGAPAGGIALLSHSGASAYGPVAAACRDRRVGLRYVVTLGNEVDLQLADFIEHLVDDSDVRVIAALVESIRDGARFLAAARRALRAGKPVVVLKVGRSEVGRRAAATHTAAMTGSEAVHRAAFRAAGVVSVDDYDDLVEVADLLASLAGAPAGADGASASGAIAPHFSARVGVVSHSGGIGALAGDRLGELGVEVPPLANETRAALAEILAGRGWAGNPADITGNFRQPAFGRTLDLLLGDPNVDVLLAATYSDEAAAHLVEARRRSPKPVVAMWTEGPRAGQAGLEMLRREGVPVFYQPTKAARGLKAWIEFARARERARADSPGFVFGPDREAVRDGVRQILAAAAKSDGGPYLPWGFAAGALRAYGVATPATAGFGGDLASAARTAQDGAVQIGYPMAVKIDSPDIPHKTEVGGVRLGIRSETELREAIADVLASARAHAPAARIDGVLVQAMAPAGVDVIVGVQRDPVFGPVLMLGLGGVMAEAMQAVAHALCPLSRADAESLIEQVPGLPRLLAGFRGQPACDTYALLNALVAISALAADHVAAIESLDVNPLRVLPRGRGALALDALITPR